MFRGINRAMTAALAAGLALAILALQPTPASAHSRRGDAAAVAAFTAVIGTIAALAAEDSRRKAYNRYYYGPYYEPYPYYAPPRRYYRDHGYRWRRHGW